MFHAPWMYRDRNRLPVPHPKEVSHKRPSATDRRAAMSASGGGGSMSEEHSNSSLVNNPAARSCSSSSESRDLDGSDHVDDSATESTGAVNSGGETTPVTAVSHVAVSHPVRPGDFRRISGSSRESRVDASSQSPPLLYTSNSGLPDVQQGSCFHDIDLTDGRRPSSGGNSDPESTPCVNNDILHSSHAFGSAQSRNVGLSNSWSGNTQITSTPSHRLVYDSDDEMGNTHWSHSYTGVRQQVFMRSSCRSNRAQLTEDLNDIYVPIIGYEMMEQRARFTVFKLHVQKNAKDSWFIFRRYTDFMRLNEQLQYLFPNFRLALPPKKWFGNNFDPMFLEDRQLGLQAFLNNICGHKDIVVSDCVREFLCVDDPPGPHDSLEESRALCESLEETIHSLKRDLSEKDRKIDTLTEELTNANRRLQELNLHQIIPNDRVPAVSSSGSESTDLDRRSCAEADQQDYSPDQEERPIVESNVSTDDKLQPAAEEETKAKEPPAFTAIPLDSPTPSDTKEAAMIVQSDVIEVT